VATHDVDSSLLSNRAVHLAGTRPLRTTDTRCYAVRPPPPTPPTPATGRARPDPAGCI
jgi:hypothetical protein